jgi:hypothetical protein
MKHVKRFEQINEAKSSPASCTNDLCMTVMPSMNSVIDMLSHYTGIPEELVKIQTELNKAAKMVTDVLRSATSTTDKLDWDVKPLAPVFILNLKNKYPQKETKYHELWYKAANRNPEFNYGASINIFKAYAKREELMLEDHDYNFELTEEEINNL